MSEEGTPKVPVALMVKFGEQEQQFNAEDIAALVTEKAALLERLEALKPVQEKFDAWKAAGWEVSPDDYMAHSSAALALIEELQEVGLVDEKGNIVGKKAEDKRTAVLPPTSGGPSTTSEDRIAAIVQKALGPVTEKLQTLENDTGMMMRKELEGRILTMNPLLDADDVQKLFGKAAAIRGNVYEMAKELSKEKGTKLVAFEESVAKRFGIDPKEFNENKLKEAKASGGASAFAEGMKFSFKKAAKGAVDPKNAMRDFFTRLGLV